MRASSAARKTRFFCSGSGVTQPKGFLAYAADATTDDDDSRAWGVLRYIPIGAAGAFPAISGIPGSTDADALITAQMSLKSDYRANATWLMNRSTAATVRKMRDGDGRYLWSDALQQGMPPMLLGSPVVLAEDMPDLAADSHSIAYGDFRQGYLIVDGPGLRVLRDPYTNKPYVRFHATKWTGGDVTDFDAIRLIRFSAS